MITETDNQKPAIRSILEKLYIKYNRRNLIEPDPLQFVYRYTNKADMEIAMYINKIAILIIITTVINWLANRIIQIAIIALINKAHFGTPNLFNSVNF